MPRKAKSYDQWESGLNERERRVDAIAQKMRAGAWLSGVSDRALAKEWNLSPEMVRQIGAEASRVLRRELRTTPEAREEARAELLQLFRVIGAKAMANGDAT